MQPRVVVIDDSDFILKLVEKSLAHLGYEMFFYLDGLDALEDIESHPPDLIILDIELPITNGLDLCKQIHKLPGNQKTPILFLSGNSGVDNRLKGYRAGGVHYIEKPFNIEELRAVCRGLLPQKSNESVSQEIGIELNKFTLKEREILTILLNNVDKVVPKEKLPGKRSLQAHISKIRKKLGDNLRIESRYGEGYILLSKTA